MNEADPLLSTEGLTRSFGSFIAVDGVDFLVSEGEIRGIIGPNGAGKSTFLGMLSGAIQPTRGTITFASEDITNLPKEAIAARGIIQSMQTTSIFASLTALENVLGGVYARQQPFFGLRAYDADPDAIEQAVSILDRVGLSSAKDMTAGELSHAEQTILEIAMAMSTDPRLLLLDEPTAGLSAEATTEIISLIHELNEDTTIVLIEHDMDMVLDTVDQLTVLHNGKVIAEGNTAEVQADERVQDVYLGRQS